MDFYVYITYKGQQVGGESDARIVMGSAVWYTVYCDQILEVSNKHDGLAILSMQEAFLKKLNSASKLRTKQSATKARNFYF